ncbi:hypothetical protein CL628_03215 [bacterium]|nr:hypothetical protein [bacterium]
MFPIKFRSIAAVIVIVVVLAGAVLSYLFLPHATVTLEPAVSERQVEQDITLSTAVTEPDFKRFILPANVVDTESTKSATIERDGGKAKPDSAKGVVRLVNKQPEEQQLLPLTHLRHEATGVMFLTDGPARIPANSEITMNITAKEKGAKGNVPAGKFIVDKLPANVQDRIFAESDIATTGGEIFDIPLTEEEITKAKDDLRADTLTQARGELTAEAGGAAIRDDLITTTIDEITASVEPGSQATSFTVAAKVRQRAFVVDEQDLLSLTLLALRASPADDEEFASFDPESFSAELIRADFERGDALIKGSLTGSFARKTEASIFDASKLAGRTVSEAQEYFGQFESVGAVTIDLSPFWVRSIPSRSTAVDIFVRQNGS